MHVLYVNHPLRVIIRKTWEVFYTAKSSLRDGLLIFQNLEITWSGNIFRLGQQINFENPKNVNFNLFKDHHFRVNLQNLGIRRPTSYIFDQALIHWIYLCHEKLKILIISFMHSVYNNLSQAFIGPIGFTVESMTNLWLYDIVCWKAPIILVPLLVFIRWKFLSCVFSSTYFQIMIK